MEIKNFNYMKLYKIQRYIENEMLFFIFKIKFFFLF